MDALQLIQSTQKIEDLLDYYGFDEMEKNGDTIRACCKIHKGTNRSAFVANTDKNMWWCHSECSHGGDMAELVMQMEGLAFQDAVKKLASIFEVSIEDLEIKKQKTVVFKQIQDFINATKKSDYKYEEFQIEHGKFVKKYRSFSIDTLKHFMLTYKERFKAISKDKKEYELYERLQVPILFDDKIIGVSLRATKEEHFPKWSHQPVNLSTKNILYNFSPTKYTESIVLVEGMFDVWAFYEIGIKASCTFGAHLTKEQIDLIIKSGVEEVVLAYDGDKAGRQTIEKASKMLKNKVKLYAIFFEQGEDPDSISREKLLQYYKEKRLIY